MILAFDVGGTFIKWALMDKYDIVESGKVPTPEDTFENFVLAIASVVNDCADLKLEGLAFSIPGTMDETGYLKQGGALRYNYDRHFVKEVSEHFQLPVTIENDARCAAIAEINIGNLQGIKDGVVAVVGTGIGGAVVKNGVVHSGYNNYAGEFSALLTRDFHKYGGGATLAGQIGMQSWTRRIRAEFNDEAMTVEQFMRLVKEGHEYALELFDEYTNLFGQSLFNIQMIYDPERILIGGGISEDKLFVDTVRTKYEFFCNMFPFDKGHAEIMACKYVNQSNLLGAASNFYNKVK